MAGNVETSQVVTDCLYGALGVLAASQGTMNNFTFGDDEHQYYETISGGSGAGPDFDGTDAVQTHMTNSRLTDPEVLEWRFPVRLESFRIRRGSGGAGRHRGGDGVERRVRFLEADDRGDAGESPARGALRRRRRRARGRRAQLDRARRRQASSISPRRSQRRWQRDDVIVIETPGGGGYGKA